MRLIEQQKNKRVFYSFWFGLFMLFIYTQVYRQPSIANQVSPPKYIAHLLVGYKPHIFWSKVASFNWTSPHDR